MANPFVIAGVALGIGGTLFGSSARKKAARASAAAARIRAKITKLENARQRRQQVRESRIQAATALAQGATRGGTTYSSSTQGRVVGVRTQLESNLDFLTTSGRLNDDAVAQEIRANKQSSRAATLGAAANLGLNIAGLYKS